MNNFALYKNVWIIKYTKSVVAYKHTLNEKNKRILL